jgi:hypothetical protein
MLLCHLAQAKSLRDITKGLRACEGKLKHSGLPDAPARSTLAYANNSQDLGVFIGRHSQRRDPHRRRETSTLAPLRDRNPPFS